MGMIIFDLRGCGGCLRPKTSYLGAHFGTLTQVLFQQEMRSVMTLSLHISNSRTKPAGLDF